MKTIEQAAAESTCLKRITVCEIYDEMSNLLARESNRCEPPGGVCCRMGVVSAKEGYPEHSTCNWTHAEEMAIRALLDRSEPHVAVIYGHDFPCPSCEAKLRAAGVEHIEMRQHPAVGLRR
jgi:deoxycytidylate deaminase